MKIAIDCRLFGNSGIGTFIKNIVEYIILHTEVSFLLIGRKEDIAAYTQFPNVHILENDIQPFSLKELFLFPVDEINQCNAFLTPYINLPGNIKVPVFSTIHDVIFFDLKEITSGIGRMLRRLFYVNVCTKSKIIFTVSEFSKSRIVHHFHPSVPIEVIYNGVAEPIKKENIGIRNKKGYILYVGNIKPHKGLKTLIEAYHQTAVCQPNLKLKIVGEYKNFKTTDHDMLQLLENHPDNIVFTGRLSDKELIRTIQEANVLVLPSLYEGFGIPPLEALYLGTDAIVSDIPALKEVYEKLPVTFFKAGNVQDLAYALQTYTPIEEEHWNAVRNQIDQTYNFRTTANHILKIIKNNL